MLTKTFEADTVADLDAAVNAFLATIAVKDILEINFSSFASAKYGTAKTFAAQVVYKA